MSPLPEAIRATSRHPSGPRIASMLLAGTALAGCRQAPADLRGLTDLVGVEVPGIVSLRVVYVICGAILLVAGWRLHRFIVALPGFAAAGSLGAAVASYVSDSPVVVVIAVLVTGGLGAWLALTLFRLAIFVSGALAGILLADATWPLIGGARAPFWGILGGAAAGGLLLLALMGVWLPIISSAIGAVLIGAGLDLGLGWMLALCAAGVLVQFGVAHSLGENAFARRATAR